MSNNVGQFMWSQDSVYTLVHDTTSDVRIVRPLLKLYGNREHTRQILSGIKSKAPLMNNVVF